MTRPGFEPEPPRWELYTLYFLKDMASVKKEAGLQRTLGQDHL
jgi:hypothetical protein